MQFHPVNQIDERFINKEPIVPMIRGAQSVSKQTISVVGAPNTSNLNWNFPITSGVCTDLDWYGTYTLTFAVVVTNTTGADILAGVKLLTYGTNMCVADYPVASLITNLNCKFNEQQLMNYNVSDYKNMLLRLGDHNKVVGEAVCPAMIETGFSNYIDSYLTRNNPMASYSDADFGSGEIPNGAWGAICAIDNTSNTVLGGNLATGSSQTVNITVTINEPLISAPFLFQHLQKQSEASPYYLRNVIINMALNQNANRFFRFGGSDITPTTPVAIAGKNITSVTLTNVGSATLNFFTLSAPLVKGFSLPEKSIIKAFDIVTSNVVGKAFASTSATQQLILSNQSLSGLPRYIVLGCRPAFSEYDPTDATWYYPITSLTVSLGNNQNILATYTIVDLYRASVRNGLKQDYISFSGIGSSIAFASAAAGGAVSVAASKPIQTCSSPIILELGTDIVLPFDVVNGSQGTFTFNFQVTCTNTEAPNALGVGAGVSTPNLFFMALYDTYFSTDSKTLQSTISRSLISPDLALEIRENVEEHEVPQSAESEVGGALHKMKSAGYSNNVSKSSAVSRLSKRLMH